MNNLINYQNYYDFLKTNVEQDASLPLIVKNAHKIFDSLTKLIEHSSVPADLRAKCFIALGYFLVPDDVFSEQEHGPIGFVEDVMVALFVHRSIMERLGDEGELLVIKVTTGSHTAYQNLIADFDKQLGQYEHHYLQALRHTGLISDDEYANIVD
jgi:uncharacterized membrane protein YkvA (DUF1232 family)